MRESGILLHVSSLPSKYGIGNFGSEAYKFVDFLEKTKQTYWQILPIGPTSYGDSPYQSFSSNALNPYFIDLEMLVDEKLIKKSDIIDSTTGDKIDYGKLYEERYLVLSKAFKNFDLSNKDFLKFLNDEKAWLHDYALFMAIKKSFDDVSLIEWPSRVRMRNAEAISKLETHYQDEINFQKFMQFKAYEQYYALKDYANSKGIKIFGDIPIYVSYDSSDVWVNPSLFQLDGDNKPTHVAGVPPDSFSADGQLWGNPLYNWEELEKTNFLWWIERIRNQAKLFDALRIDHFIGFVNYFKIPAQDKTARNGVWVKGVGSKLFKAIKAELGDLNIIAEDLGLVTDDVIALLEETNFPGMKLLHFAFDPAGDSNNLPHFHPVNSVAYPGTHDNETSKQWLENLNEESFEFFLNYTNSNRENALNSIIKETLKSPARIAVIPMQDYLGLGSFARMNIPSTLGNNWDWRLSENYLDEELVNKVLLYTKTFGRVRKD